VSDEEFYENLRMVEDFWEEKSDVTRYSGWETFKPFLLERRPDVYMIIENYLKAERAMNSIMRNL
jgi:hypothetical protein